MTRVPASSALLGASSAADLPFAVRGHGVYIEDADGRDYLDGSSGALAAALGHGREDLARVLSEQAAAVAFAHRTQFRHESTEELAELVAAAAPGDLSRCLFASSGSDANEIALSVAVRYHRARGEAGRTRLLARDRGYHGATLGALALTGLVERRAALEPILPNVLRLPAPGPELDDAGERALLDELDAAFDAVEPGTLAAVFVELVAGAAGGAIVSPASYVERLARRTREAGALLVADEVMTGFGRTGRAFASEHYGLVPDILTFGKGVSGGYMPLSGVIVSEPVSQAIADVGGVGLGHTYMNVPIASAVGRAAAGIILRPAFLQRAAEAGDRLGALLAQVVADLPDTALRTRGIGLMRALDVRDVAGDQAAGMARLRAALREAGLIVYPATPYRVGDDEVLTILVAPPLVITDEELSDLALRLRRGLTGYLIDE